MGYVLIDRCKCGSNISVVRFRGKDPITHIEEDVVSHGICTGCLTNVVLPNEHWRFFTNEHCRFIR